MPYAGDGMLGQLAIWGMPKLYPGPPECGIHGWPCDGMGAPYGAYSGRAPVESRPVTGFQPPDMVSGLRSVKFY